MRMPERTGMEVSIALSEAVKMCKTDVVSAYPITPQTHIVEHLAELVADDEMDAEFIPVESEHSALSACLGSSAVGARTFTATAGQGLELMHEVMYIASSMRLPIVMALCNRALSAPLSVWCDHGDAMSIRDTGWIQVFAENGQEVFDMTIQAFRIAEDADVLLPVVVNLDGFNLTHVVEPIILPDQEQVDRYLPEFHYPYPLHPDKPVSMGTYAPPHLYIEVKKAQDEALKNSKQIILKAWDEFRQIFGREYNPIELYCMDDADVAVMAMGSINETVSLAIDELREEGLKVGQLKLRLWRPFPHTELREVVKSLKTLIVIDRAISFGGPGGPVCSEVRSSLYEHEGMPHVIGFVTGLGGREVKTSDFKKMVRKGVEQAEKGLEEDYEIVGARE